MNAAPGESGATPSAEHFDLVIIGSGSGNSLITEAWEGRRVAVVDAGTFGGTCLNVGCIPSKAMLNNSHLYHAAKHEFKGRGIDGALPPPARALDAPPRHPGLRSTAPFAPAQPTR